MAAKVLFFNVVLSLLLNALSAPAPNDCTCQDDESIKEAEEYLRILRLKDAIKDNEEFPLIPGQLSLSIPCSNCIEYNRKKRKVFPTSEPIGIKNNGPVYDKKCPMGSKRLGFWCVEELFYDDY